MADNFARGGLKMRIGIFTLIITCTMLMSGSAFAQGIEVPGDSNGDNIVSAEEVAAATTRNFFKLFNLTPPCN